MHSAPVAEHRIGKDGKWRRVPAKSPEPELGPEAGNGAEPLMATLPSDIRKDSITEALSPPQPKISQSPPAEAAPPQPIKSGIGLKEQVSEEASHASWMVGKTIRNTEP